MVPCIIRHTTAPIGSWVPCFMLLPSPISFCSDSPYPPSVPRADHSPCMHQPCAPALPIGCCAHEGVVTDQRGWGGGSMTGRWGLRNVKGSGVCSSIGFLFAVTAHIPPPYHALITPHVCTSHALLHYRLAAVHVKEL